MRFEDFKRQIGVPLFDTAFARQAVQDFGSDGYLAVQFSRWVAAKRLIALRRGLYAVADAPVHQLAVANRLVEPSYVSGEYALSWYGLIPEAVWTVTCACLRTPRVSDWQNVYGHFQYHQVKLYEGFKRLEIQDNFVFFAEAEKALLDFWHWQSGEWSQARHESMRYQNAENLDLERLKNLAENFSSPRLLRALKHFYPVIAAVDEEEKEGVSV